ncbi:MAG: monovalent cation/H+ antiporter subunit D family protein, partial [Gammaproteobacteria bacterium]
MLLSNLPALQVVIPLVSAPVCLLLRNPRHAWACALIISWLVLAMALLLLQQVYTLGTISYAIGAWATPWGIEYRIDMAGALMILIIASVGAVTMPYAWRSIQHELHRKHTGVYYTCYLLCLTG